jgi:hypothetical protein
MILSFLSGEKEGIHAFYSAHATCLGHKNRELTSDYPGVFKSALRMDTTLSYSGFSAGAVASMAVLSEEKDWEAAEDVGNGLAEQVQFARLLSIKKDTLLSIRSIRLPVELREPSVKVSRNLGIRTWLVDLLMGSYQNHLTVLQLNNTLLIGIPADFSGELAVPLYEYARSKGLNLIISSFNGGYIGYIPKDEWYDLEKYETRSMSWHGFDNGAYFTEMITRLIDLSAKR